MRKSIKNNEGKIILENLIKTIQKNKDYLSEIDTLLGDGDHGINMNKGFSLCYERIKNQEVTLSLGFEILGNVLLSEIGGSMGPLYGMLFLGMSSSVNGKEEINKYDFSKMIHKAIDEISSITEAKVGDKTLLDTLMPAINAFDKEIDSKNFYDLLNDLIEASGKGMNSTKNMIAKFGRGSRLGEASKGHLDVGAVSCHFVLQSIANTMKHLLLNS